MAVLITKSNINLFFLYKQYTLHCHYDLRYQFTADSSIHSFCYSFPFLSLLNQNIGQIFGNVTCKIPTQQIVQLIIYTQMSDIMYLTSNFLRNCLYINALRLLHSALYSFRYNKVHQQSQALSMSFYQKIIFKVYFT